MTSPLLDINDLSVSYDSVQALRGVSLQVPKGSVVCLIGANGAGKSTVLRAISGLKKPGSGQILFKGQSISSLRPEEVVRLGVVQSPEGRGIFPNLTIAENLDLGAYVRQDQGEIKRDLEKVYALFPRLKERVKQLAGTLSGGEQQMLAMGRALMARPELLLLDEPSLGLAPQVIELIFETVAKINREGTTILLVEQNAQLALEASHYAYVLETGSTILEGEASKVLNDPRVKEAYLGETA
ncbi:MAG TPA: ABC transporter ATP-binding protein [bacterium]|jgi:branched-chain amino acid transport system ATP-binding protein|nr:ABC transporter ATP-binding protein [bacterium]